MEDRNISEQIQIMQPRNRRFLSGTSVDQKQVLWNSTTCEHMRPANRGCLMHPCEGRFQTPKP